MPSLPCPECLQELLPQDLVHKGEALACPKCGREIYQRKHTDIHLICPKCGESTDADAFHPVHKPA